MRTTKPISIGRGDAREVSRELVSRIQDAIIKENCVVFLGAGSTTERMRQGRPTFYECVRKLCKIRDRGRSFPELMQYFCDHIDGGHHNRLIREAINRIEIYCVRGEDNFFATTFTDALAEIPYFNRFVTTNWDPFLERSLDVLVPMVEDRDLAFWDDSKRQVLKIHGCITRPYSIVATQSDYDACMKLSPLIFNKMKDLMATKTFLFSGYSMRDPDFESVWNLICGSLGHFAHTAYALDPNASDDQISSWGSRGIQIFRTTDVMFLRTLRSLFEKKQLIPASGFIEFLNRERRRISSLHVRMGQESVGKLSSAMYQDGLLHELESVVASARLGTKKKNDFDDDYGKTIERVERMREIGNPIEIAYWSGRAEVLSKLRRRDRSRTRTYFHPNRLTPISKLVKGPLFSRLTPRSAVRK
jgi:hypothetical protein